ncbi:hypothetical protein KQX54_016487 [Cotesia glomerata]|uniref:Uncharacterized protein n=1 Tax=Cotesia glomerata TaxID=32391 RepID=A0AAV7I9S0_COTGL|nr:hypothetical protein KQX54_016487 [Cotesia glomerata]
MLCVFNTQEIKCVGANHGKTPSVETVSQKSPGLEPAHSRMPSGSYAVRHSVRLLSLGLKCTSEKTEPVDVAGGPAPHEPEEHERESIPDRISASTTSFAEYGDVTYRARVRPHTLLHLTSYM